MGASRLWEDLKAELVRGNLGALAAIRDHLADAAEFERGPGSVDPHELIHDLITSVMAVDCPVRHKIIIELRALCLDQSIQKKKKEGLRRLSEQGGDAPSGMLRELSLDPLIQTELRNEVKGALRTLSKGEVEALTLVHDGKGAEEISRIFDALGRPKSIPEVRALIARARLRYRHALASSLRARRDR